MNIHSFLISALGLFFLPACVLLPPVPPKISQDQSDIINTVRRSLPTRNSTFAALLTKLGNHSHFEKKQNVAQSSLNDVSGVRAFAKGVSEEDLRDAGVQEYAFLKAVSGRTFFCWRVFVRNGLVVYIEFTPASESDFRYYFQVPK